ncbi:sarcosine oxidase subunit gamma [Cryobacterium levicorallinum]|uniref:Sarcosine oxidase subunit gamma n=1 Tax=Cryobacterium levicorallinum TaxID=995038 RepID=A0A1I2Z8J0_9MICO|nr:sarcosine oxidase subunit gamma family protein [Cryobacterium levicorallinum]TFB82845.1 sarcosine oxidase subunit gamma [Cryobacterium levicorallinum]GEP25716.1 sarcosine oxidase subunit gamma [Cryobacterium levicorallinum]SFH34157.1 sarcosine oxidase subunit gamma [Cryobacterium levicorallinum]
MVNTTESTDAQITDVQQTHLTARRHSPAEHLWAEFAKTASAEARVSLREIPFQVMVGIRVDPLSEGGRRIGAVTGGLPTACGQVTTGVAGMAVLWLGPDEFLLVAEEEALDGTLAAELVAALGDGAGQTVDLSSNRTTFELAGPSARAVLEKSCAADLHPRAFSTGVAIATVIGNVPVVLWKTDNETFRVFPRASFADYLGRWLLDGMREFTVAESTTWH